MKKKTIRYSQSFKQSVVRAIEEGQFENCFQARQKYGLGSGTVESWVRRLGKNHLIGKVVRVETPEEKNELKRLKQRVQLLERTLADTTVDLAIERAYTEMLAQEAGVEDLAAFKKKADEGPRAGR